MVLLALLCLLWVSGEVPDLIPTGEPERGFRALEALVADAVIADSLGEPLDGASIDASLDELIRAVSTAMLTRVDVYGPALEVQARTDRLFGRAPSLPPGDEPHHVVLELEAGMLFVYGMRLEADRPVQIQRVVLRFADGSVLERVLEVGAGRLVTGALSPLIGDEGGPARVLRQVEITGWTRHESTAARLEMSFSIPDPDARPFRDAMAELMSLKDRWARLPLDEDGLARRARDLRLVAPLLALDPAP